jgi:hypothetical protein
MSDISAQSAPLPIDCRLKAPQTLDKRGKPLKVNGKNKAACDFMVWQGLTRRDAAKAAGLTDAALYAALTKPHVKAYYLTQCEVLRTSGRARRIHRLEAMQEQDDNKAAVVNAILAIEGMGNDQASVNAQQTHSPGVVIQIINTSAVPIVAPQHPIINVGENVGSKLIDG